MSTCYITIKDASELSGKSIQTVRRLIKSKKVKFRRDKTPQGFNYLIDESSFVEFYNIARSQKPIKAKKETSAKTTKAVTSKKNTPQESKSLSKSEGFEAAVEFNDTLRHLIKQHSTEKESLFKLIDSFQGKVIALENRLKIESEKSNKPWYRLW